MQDAFEAMDIRVAEENIEKVKQNRQTQIKASVLYRMQRFAVQFFKKKPGVKDITSSRRERDADLSDKIGRFLYNYNPLSNFWIVSTSSWLPSSSNSSKALDKYSWAWLLRPSLL